MHSKRNNRTVQSALTDLQWIRDVDYDMSLQNLHEFIQLWTLLQEIQLQPEQEDQITWLLTADGSYTAGSAYRIQFLGTTISMTASLTWRTRAPPKNRFFVWLMLQNKIWTAARQLQRQWPNDYFCPLCIRSLETSLHLFTNVTSLEIFG